MNKSFAVVRIDARFKLKQCDIKLAVIVLTSNLCITKQNVYNIFNWNLKLFICFKLSYNYLFQTVLKLKQFHKTYNDVYFFLTYFDNKKI